MEISLRQFSVNPKLFENLGAIEQVVRSYKAVGKEIDFQSWIKKCLDKAENELVRANFYWVLEDYENTAKSLTAYYKNEPSYLTQWKENFRAKGKDVLKIFLTHIVEINPQDAITRIELLDLDNKQDANQEIAILEILWDQETPPVFVVGKGVYNRTQFRNYFDLAYRLMRLYEKSGKISELKKLGLRIAKAEKPFQSWPMDIKDKNKFTYRSNNDFPEDLNACFSLLIQYADDQETQEVIAKALTIHLYPPAQSQLDRRQQKQLWNPKVSKPSFGWANLPQGVSLHASNENVLALASDEQYIFTGQPWGVGVYTKEGRPVTRIALATAGMVLENEGDDLWVGSPIGLYRINKKDWKISYMRCDQDLPSNERNQKDNFDFHNGVMSLALDGDILWIGTRRNIQAYNVKTKDFYIYTQNDLKLDSHADWRRFIIGAKYIWADSDYGIRRFDKNLKKWDAVTYNEKPFNLIDIIDGELWGHVNLGDPLRDRPCLIDQNTLMVTPVLIDETNLTKDQRMINGPFGYYGKNNDQFFFVANSQAYLFDREKFKLRPIDLTQLSSSEPLPGLKSTQKWTNSNLVKIYTNDQTHQQMLTDDFYLYSGEWQIIPLDNTKIVLGSKLERFPRYQYPSEDRPMDDDQDTSEYEGGLYIIKEGKTINRISGGFADSLLGDDVYRITFDNEKNAWLSTSLGIVVLDSDDKVRTTFSRKDGLLANRIRSGALFSDKMYFASGWGDSGGGLIVYDPKTFVFSSLITVDDLPSNKIKSVKDSASSLSLEFLSEYQRSGNFGYVLHSPAQYDPTAKKLISGGEGHTVTQNESMGWDKKESREELPYLGGYVLGKIEHNNKQYLYGTRGLVIMQQGRQPSYSFAEIETHYTLSDQQAEIKEAKASSIHIDTPADLRQYLNNKNGFIRAQALTKLSERFNFKDIENNAEFVDSLVSLNNDSNINVRYTDMYLLSRIKNDKIIPALKKYLQDNDPYIRAMAALVLVRNYGIVSDTSYFEEILTHPNRYGNLPYGVDSTIGVEVDQQRLYEALAPYADEKIFGLLLKYPLPADDYGPRQKVFTLLGEALKKHPDAAKILLKAYDADPYSWGQQRFSQAVFKAAGKELLPFLHQGLLSQDRVVRSNAARACGAIADPSSIDLLITSFDLESGLSQGSIVWALGELRTEKAVPYLVKLYVKAKNDEKCRAGTGMRMAQAAAVD